MGLWRAGHKQVNAKSQPLSRRRRRRKELQLQVVPTTTTTTTPVDNTRSIIERRTNYFENVCLKLCSCNLQWEDKNKTWVI